MLISDGDALPAAAGRNGAGLESTIVDDTVMALLEAVRTGQLPPAEAAMHLRERSAGYQQVRHIIRKPCLGMRSADPAAK